MKTTSKRYLTVTLLNVIITIAEFIGGAVSGSLALLSDAVHNLSDVGAIVLSYLANHIAQRKKDHRQTFGYQRAETLAAFTNGLILLVISLFLFVEAIQRFASPQKVSGQLMLIIAVIGLMTNGVSMLLMASQARHNLNVKVMFLNMMSDAISSVAVVLGAIIITVWHVYWVDPALTMMASLFLLKEAYQVTKKAAAILMEANPDVDLEQIKKLVLTVPGVENIHHVHVWRYSDQMIMLDAHLNVDQKMTPIDLEKLYATIDQKLKPLGINHVTLQAECHRGLSETMISQNYTD